MGQCQDCHWPLIDHNGQKHCTRCNTLDGVPVRPAPTSHMFGAAVAEALRQQSEAPEYTPHPCKENLDQLADYFRRSGVL